jgi:hypothetical protein
VFAGSSRPTYNTGEVRREHARGAGRDLPNPALVSVSTYLPFLALSS